MNASSATVHDAIAEEAATWLVTLREPGAEGRLREEFVAWLRRSPLHVEEYLRIASTERLLRRGAQAPLYTVEALLADASRDDAVTPLRAISSPAPARGRRRAGPRWIAAAAVVALVGVVASWLYIRPATSVPVAYVTPRGEQGSWNLVDGTTVELDTDSAVRVRYSAAERLVEVERGRAYFHVAKDPQRHFRVAAGTASVVALGTRFDVYRRAGDALVTLVEGRVALYAAYDAARAPGGAPLPARELAAGQQATIGAQSVSVPVPTDLVAAEAWRSGQIVFSARPLAEVASEFNRYAGIPLEVADESLGRRSISGSFNAHDLDSFLAFLQVTDDVVVERGADRIRVHRRASAALSKPSGAASTAPRH